MSFVYISYNPADLDFAHVLRGQLEAEGYMTWMDELRQPEKQLFSILQNAIDSSAAVVLVSTHNVAHSDMVWWELSYAQKSGKPIFTINAEEEFPGLLEQLVTLLPKNENHEENVTLPNPLSTDEIVGLQKMQSGQNNLWIVVVIVVVILGVGLWLVQGYLFSPQADANLIDPVQVESPGTLPPSTVETSAGADGTEEIIEPSFSPLPTDQITPVATVVPTLAPSSTASPTASPTATRTPDR